MSSFLHIFGGTLEVFVLLRRFYLHLIAVLVFAGSARGTFEDKVVFNLHE